MISQTNIKKKQLLRLKKSRFDLWSLIFLSTFSHTVIAVDNIPLLKWNTLAQFSNINGCGFTTPRYTSYSAKSLADKMCEHFQQYYSCEQAKGYSIGMMMNPPSVFYSLVIPPDPESTASVYSFRCTNQPYPNAAWSLNGIADKVAPEVCGVGNPINPANGNKYQNESVYQDAVNTLSFEIFYNSSSGNVSSDPKQAGASWRSSYDRYVNADLFSITTQGFASVHRADGYAFGFKNNNGAMLASSNKTYNLVRQQDTQGSTTGWTYLNDITGDLESYNAQGLLQSISSRSGNIRTLAYSTSSTPFNIAPRADLLIKVTDALGRSINFSYDSSSRLKVMNNPQGAQYIFSYDNDINNNLISVIFPDSKFRTFHYEDTTYKTALTGITDENASRFATWSYATWAYAGTSRAVSSEHAGSADKVTILYTTNGSAPTSTQVTNSVGAVRTYNFTTILGVVKSTGQTQPAGSGCAASAAALTYDVNGNVASRTDFNLNKTTYAYDMSRNLETSRTEGLTTANALTTATRTITTSWHPTWRLPLVVTEYSGGTANLSNGSGAPTGTALRITTNTYDTKGNITSVTEADPVRSLSRTTTTTYTYSTTVPGLILTKVVDGPRTDVSDITTYTYYPHDATCTASSATPIIDPITSTSPPNLGCRGQLQSITNALNQTTSYNRYNHHGQVEQMTDANGLVTTNTYDLRQRLLTRTVGTETTSLIYDGVGQVTQLTMPDNSQLNYTYDAAHRLTDVQDNLGNKVHYTLDTEGNRLNESTTDPANQLTKTLSRSYDALNRLQQVTGLE